MFTKISKVVMWIGIVACFVLSIVIGTQFRGFGFWVMLGGWAATLVIFSSFGMVIEMAENIKKSREIIETMSRNDTEAKGILSAASASEVSNTKASLFPSSEVSNAKASLFPSSEASDYWKCPTCGATNSGTRRYCEKCDTPK